MSQKRAADALVGVLADCCVLRAKVQSFAWNVEGPHFRALRQLFREMATELDETCDNLAERIRAADEYTPATFKELSKLAEVKEAEKPETATAMLEELREAVETASKRAAEAHGAASAAPDPGSAAVLAQACRVLDEYELAVRSTLKGAWMMRVQTKDDEKKRKK